MTSATSKQALGSRIRKLRQRLNLTQGEFAKMLSDDALQISSKSISAYEQGDIYPSIPVIDRIVRRTDCSFRWMMSGDEGQDITPVETPEQEERRLLELFKQMDREARQAFLALAEVSTRKKKGGCK